MGKGKNVMNPLVDWSFKFLLGTERNKHNLIGFLNLLLMPQDGSKGRGMGLYRYKEGVLHLSDELYL